MGCPSPAQGDLGHRADVRCIGGLSGEISWEPRGNAAQPAQEYGDRFPEAICCLEEGPEDSPRFYSFPEIDLRKISSTDMSERTVREVRRWSRVIGAFPSVESWIRFETCDLMEYSEDGKSDRSCIERERVQEVMKRNRTFRPAQADN